MTMRSTLCRTLVGWLLGCMTSPAMVAAAALVTASGPARTDSAPSDPAEIVRERIASFRDARSARLSFVSLTFEVAAAPSGYQRPFGCSYDVSRNISEVVDLLLQAQISAGYPQGFEKSIPETRFGIIFWPDTPEEFYVAFTNPWINLDGVFGFAKSAADPTAITPISANWTLRDKLLTWARNHGQLRGESEQLFCKNMEMIGDSKVSKLLTRAHSVAGAYGDLGMVDKTLAELVQAEAMGKEALEINEALGNKEGMAKAYGNLGRVYQNSGDLVQAEAMYKKVLEIEEALDNKAGMANAYGNLGNVMQTRRDLLQAEAMYQRALELHEAVGRRVGMAADYANLGNVSQINRDLEKAVVAYKKAIVLFQDVGVAADVQELQRQLAALSIPRADAQSNSESGSGLHPQ
jgi:tetratricopeptide (TPR) repeat protein